MRVGDDIFSRPLNSLRITPVEDREVQISDQARLIELLQVLMFVGHTSSSDGRVALPKLGILLTCWDELGFQGRPARCSERTANADVKRVCGGELARRSDPRTVGAWPFIEP